MWFVWKRWSYDIEIWKWKSSDATIATVGSCLLWIYRIRLLFFMCCIFLSSALFCYIQIILYNLFELPVFIRSRHNCFMLCQVYCGINSIRFTSNQPQKINLIEVAFIPNMEYVCRKCHCFQCLQSDESILSPSWSFSIMSSLRLTLSSCSQAFTCDNNVKWIS